MNTHTMGLNTDALLLIKKGTKTIEMRVYDEQRQEIAKEDYIIFIDTIDAKNKLKVRVKELYRYDSFDELYKEFDKVKLGYDEEDIALPTDMEKYYPKEKIKKYGVLGIEVEVM